MRLYPWVKQVNLFGSRGDGDERSDIDLAIEAPEATQRDWVELYFSIEELDTLLKIDIVRLDEAAEEFRRQILSQGVTLYEQT